MEISLHKKSAKEFVALTDLAKTLSEVVLFDFFFFIEALDAFLSYIIWHRVFLTFFLLLSLLLLCPFGWFLYFTKHTDFRVFRGCLEFPLFYLLHLLTWLLQAYVLINTSLFSICSQITIFSLNFSLQLESHLVYCIVLFVPLSPLTSQIYHVQNGTVKILFVLPHYISQLLLLRGGGVGEGEDGEKERKENKININTYTTTNKFSNHMQFSSYNLDLFFSQPFPLVSQRSHL